MPEFHSVQVCSEVKLLERVFKERLFLGTSDQMQPSGDCCFRIYKIDDNDFLKVLKIADGPCRCGRTHTLFLSLYIDTHCKPVIFWTIHQQKKSDGTYLTLPEEIHFLFV